MIHSYLKTTDQSLFFLPFLKYQRKLFFIQLYSYFNEKNFLNDNQYGVRAKYSTESELMDIIVTKMDNNDIRINVFLDLSKALDTWSYHFTK